MSALPASLPQPWWRASGGYGPAPFMLILFPFLLLVSGAPHGHDGEGDRLLCAREWHRFEPCDRVKMEQYLGHSVIAMHFAKKGIMAIVPSKTMGCSIIVTNSGKMFVVKGTPEFIEDHMENEGE